MSNGKPPKTKKGLFVDFLQKTLLKPPKTA
jgi:hypothetical protein